METEITIALYFLFILSIGIYSAFKIKSPSDYYVAGKRAGLLTVSGSLLATILGGSAILGTIELSRDIGWAALWFLFSAAFGLFVLIPVSRRVSRFGNFTLPELLGKFYNKKAEQISSLVIPVAWLGIIAAQIIAAAKILNSLGFISYPNAALLSGSVFIVYTLLGGQLSILKTDTLQALLIFAGLAALVLFSLNDPMVTKVEKLSFKGLFNASFTGFDLLILVLSYSVTFIVGPDIYSRIFCAKNEQTASRSILLVAIILLPASFALTYLGIFSVQAGEEGIVTYAGVLLPDWAFGLFIAALLSAVMSSADTTLLTSALIFNELIAGDLNNRRSMINTRWTIIVIGIISVFIALFVTSIIQSLLFALTVFSGAFFVPMLAGLLKLKVKKENIVYAVIAGGITALAGKIMHDYIWDITGSLLIVSAHFINLVLLQPVFKRLPGNS